jgi:hypothetical protein
MTFTAVSQKSKSLEKGDQFWDQMRLALEKRNPNSKMEFCGSLWDTAVSQKSKSLEKGDQFWDQMRLALEKRNPNSKNFDHFSDDRYVVI